MRLRFPEVWTHQQRRVLGIVLLLLCGYFAIRLYQNRQTVPEALPDEGPRAAEVMSQLDLNTADAATLAAIPRLGTAKAQAIVAYRDQFVAAHPRERAFERMDQLFHVKGIGPSTMELLKHYTFIAPRSAPKPG